MKKNFDAFLRETKMETASPLLISEPPMQFLPTLASVLSTDCALFLQQLRYWMNHSSNIKDGRRWVYNSVDEWRLQFYWMSRSTLKRVISTLKNFEYHEETYHIIETRNLNADRTNQRLFYTINDSELRKLAVISRYERIRKVQEIVKGNRYLQERLASGHLPQSLLQNELAYDLAGFDELIDEYLQAMPDAGKVEPPTAAETPMAQNEPMGGETPMVQNEPMGKTLPMAQNEPMGNAPMVQNEPMGEALNSRHWFKMSQCNGSNWTNAMAQNEPMQWLKMNQSTNIQENTKHETTQENSLSGTDAQQTAGSSPETEQEERERLGRFRDVLIENDIKLGLTNKSMAELLHKYPESVISLAIQKAAENNARSLGYVKTLLENEDFSLRLTPSNKRRKERMPYEPAGRVSATDGESGDEWKELGRRMGYYGGSSPDGESGDEWKELGRKLGYC